LKYRSEISIVLALSVSANRSDNALFRPRALAERSLSCSNDYGRDSWRLSCNWWWSRSSNDSSGWSWRLSSHDDDGRRWGGEENVHFRIFLSINREIKRPLNWSIFVNIILRFHRGKLAASIPSLARSWLVPESSWLEPGYNKLLFDR